MDLKTKSERLEELAYDLYNEFYENPDKQIHYAEINQKLAENDLPTELPFKDFLADCINLGVSHSNSDKDKLNKRQLVGFVLD